LPPFLKSHHQGSEDRRQKTEDRRQ
jgi:hypothetical protein